MRKKGGDCGLSQINLTVFFQITIYTDSDYLLLISLRKYFIAQGIRTAEWENKY